MLTVVDEHGPNCALTDNGATTSCTNKPLGILRGTFKPKEGMLGIGDANAGLQTHGTNLHALTIISLKTRDEYDCVRCMQDTPTSLAMILAEPVEVYTHGTAVSWNATYGRVWHMENGVDIQLDMSPNGLGWVMVKPLTDPERIRNVLSRDAVTIVVSPSDQILMPVTQSGQITSPILKPSRSSSRHGIATSAITTTST